MHRAAEADVVPIEHETFERVVRLAATTVPLAAVALAAIGMVLILRASRRQRHLQRAKERGSSESLNEHEAKASTSTAGLRWWDWRRWVDSQDEAHHYFPLSEQRPHRHADS